MEARSPVQQQGAQLYEGDFLELEAEAQDTEFSDDTLPLTEEKLIWRKS